MAKATVESIDLLNYRQLVVTFNTVVDTASATSPLNYYFEIVEGQAGPNLGVSTPTLTKDLNLAELLSGKFASGSGLSVINSPKSASLQSAMYNVLIETDAEDFVTDFSNVAADFEIVDAADVQKLILLAGATNGDVVDGITATIDNVKAAKDLLDEAYKIAYTSQFMTATTVNGKTTVTVNLPADTRFVQDLKNTDSGKVISVQLANGATKNLVGDTIVNIAVRNVKDAAGVRNIDTAVKQLKIADTVAPTLVATEKIGYNGVTSNFTKTVELQLTENGASEGVQLVYSEPVKNATGDGVISSGDTAGVTRALNVYVNGKQLDAEEIGNFVFFNNESYNSVIDESKVQVDVQGLVNKVLGDNTFAINQTYNIKINGVTDLAGNVQVPTDIVFDAKVVPAKAVNPGPSAPTVAPEILGVKQVADNILRVQTNQANVTGHLTIDNADGEKGVYSGLYMPLSTKGRDGNFYSYVVLENVVDNETTGDSATVTVTKDDNVLAYDGNDYVIRNLVIDKVSLVNAEGKVDKKGDVFIKNGFYFYKDIQAPVVSSTGSIKYSSLGTKLTINVRDLVPADVSQDYTNVVNAALYAYNAGVIDRTTIKDVNEPADGNDFLPIKVSYVDEKGITRQATVSNKNLEGGTTGYANAIKYNPETGVLTIDLAKYGNLLDKETEKLVDGVSYKVELEKGFFADAALEDMNTDPKTAETDKFKTATKASAIAVTEIGGTIGATVTTADAAYNVYYVSESRQDIHGYTSVASTVTITTGAEPEKEDKEEYNDVVPQTSKELIQYDVDRNELTIEFKGSIDPKTIKNPANYVINGRSLAEWGLKDTDLTYVVFDKDEDNTTLEDDQYFVKFVVPTDSVSADADVAFEIFGVANQYGAKMTPVKTTVFLRDNTRSVINGAQIISETQITLSFDEQVKYKAGAEKVAAAKNFKVMAGNNEVSVFEAVVNEDNTVTLNLSKLPKTGLLTVQVQEDQNNDILIVDDSVLKNPLNSDKVFTIRN